MLYRTHYHPVSNIFHKFAALYMPYRHRHTCAIKKYPSPHFGEGGIYGYYAFNRPLHFRTSG